MTIHADLDEFGKFKGAEIELHSERDKARRLGSFPAVSTTKAD